MKESNSTTKQTAALVVTCALVVATLSIAPMGAVAQNVGTNTQAPTEIDSCTVIDQPGRYVLTQDIINSTADTCIEITISDVTLDGEGYTIDGTGSGFGIFVDGYDDVTVKNVVVSDWSNGVIYFNAPNGKVLDSTIRNNDDGIQFGEFSSGTVRNTTVRNNGVGISLTYTSGSTVADSRIVSNKVGIVSSGADRIVDSNISDNSDTGIVINGFVGRFGTRSRTITGNRITGNGDSGIVLSGTVVNSRFYNNFFNNADNVEFAPNFAGTENQWNVSKQPGPNIVGGPFVGGNYYAKPGGAKGYSEQCTDTNGDGFCDQPYALGGSGAANTDYLPLAASPSSTAPTEIDSCTVINQSGRYVLTADIENSTTDQCIQIFARDVVFDGAGHTIDGVDDFPTGGIVVFGRDGAFNVTVTNVTVTDWGTGITYASTTGEIRNSVVASNSRGIAFTYGAGGIVVANTTARGNDLAGFYIQDASDNLFVDDRASNNGWAYVSVSSDGPSPVSSEDNTVKNLALDSATVSFESKDIKLGAVESPPTAPAGLTNVGGYVNVTSSGDDDDAFLALSVHYTDAAVANANVNENTLRLYAFSEGNWSPVPDSSANTKKNVVSAKMTALANGTVLAPFGDDAGKTEQPPDDSNAPTDDGDDTPPDNGDDVPSDDGNGPPDDGGHAPTEESDDAPTDDKDAPSDDEEITLVCEAGSTDEVLGENDEDDDGDGAIDEDDEDNDGPSNDDDDGDGAVDEDDECDDGDDGSDEFNGNAEDDDDGDGAVDEDDEPDSGNSDDVDNDGDGAIDEDDEADTDD